MNYFRFFVNFLVHMHDICTASPYIHDTFPVEEYKSGVVLNKKILYEDLK
jgi:hypothetical protein